jgi:hypothetical protein
MPFSNLKALLNISVRPRGPCRPHELWRKQHPRPMFGSARRLWGNRAPPRPMNARPVWRPLPPNPFPRSVYSGRLAVRA